MAASCVNLATRLSPVSFARKGEKSSAKKAENGVDSGLIDSKSKRVGWFQSEEVAVTCTPVVLEFRRLFQSAKFKSVSLIPGVPNQELLHAVIALYDVCLPDITPEVLYFTVCGKWAKTILLIRDIEEVAGELTAKAGIRGEDDTLTSSDTNASQTTAGTTPDLTVVDLETEGTPAPDHAPTRSEQDNVAEEVPTEEETDNKVTESGEEGETKKLFGEVFSDTDSEKESDSDDEEEDYTVGQDAFLSLVRERRKQRQLALSQGKDPSSHIGIESRLIACATWEKSTIRPGEKNTQIDLLAVRRRYRKLGIGRYLIQTLKDVSVVGAYDALVVYADHSALDFFGRHGFDDDIVLNSKFSDLADNWTNCTLMCYLPPFSGQTILMDTDAGLDLKLMELELQKWSIKTREAHQAQMACAMKLKHEVISLRALVTSQQNLIQSLTHELEKLGADKFHMEKDFLQQQLADLKIDVALGSRVRSSNGINLDDDSSDDEETDKLIRDLQQKIMTLGTTETDSSPSDGLINWKIAEEFKQSMDDSVMAGMCVISKTIKANCSASATEMFNTRCSHLRDPSIRTKMYLCGTLQHPERITKILSNGFSEQDFNHGEFGVGLYFSQHASKAAHFSALGKIILADVGLGKTDSIVKTDNTRTIPPEGYDTIVTPGRLSLLSGGDGMISGCQEYVIFDPCQALPLYLIEYKLE